MHQAAAWRLLFELVEQGQFEATAAMAFKLHKVAAKEEALEWGQFFYDVNKRMGRFMMNAFMRDCMDSRVIRIFIGKSRWLSTFFKDIC